MSTDAGSSRVEVAIPEVSERRKARGRHFRGMKGPRPAGGAPVSGFLAE